MSANDKIFIDGIKNNFDNNNNLSIPLASTGANGLMSSEDKEFIDNIKDSGILQIGQTEITE